jgi:hypothetical protein
MLWKGMSDALRGSLQQLGAPALIRFLSGLGRSGVLRVRDAERMVELRWEQGRLTAATAGEVRGLSALAPLVLWPFRGEFTFTFQEPDDPPSAPGESGESGEPGGSSEALATHDALVAYLEHAQSAYAAAAAAVPSPFSVPVFVRRTTGDEPPSVGEHVALTRGLLRTLLQVDGQRTAVEVAEAAGAHGVAETVQQIAALVELGLVRVDPERALLEDVAAAAPISVAPLALAPPATDAFEAEADSVPPAALVPALVEGGDVGEPVEAGQAGETSQTLAEAAHGLAYWQRTLTLAVIVLALLLLTWRQQASLPVINGQEQASASGVGDLRTVAEEGPKSAWRGWPNNPQSTAWVADGVYHLLAREPDKFVAVGAPSAGVIQDALVTATMRKVGGPTGQGYGLIVRSQGPGAQDGVNQNGHFYVFAVGDTGAFGAWRRDGDAWTELQPWTRSDAVRPGGEPNTLAVLAQAQDLIFTVNGTQVARQVDTALVKGTVGVFAGGDGNEVVVDRFAAQVPG